jgi:50S ribosomal protein L16 3-hydroxylase
LKHAPILFQKVFRLTSFAARVVASLHIIDSMRLHMLGGLTARTFLRRCWQKRPLFVRGALPQFAGPQDEMSDLRALCALAKRDDVESRIVERRGNRWETQHGPFKRTKVGSSNWTILVSGVNLHVPAADALLRRFRFIPQARLDDVMVSFAAPGGGVGPHVDSYDVFLVQGFGRRRWRVGRREYLTGPGDLLYVPPGMRHDGVALEPCATFSVGFRAPRGAELGAAFLDWLHERGLPDAAYRDPGLRPTARPSLIPKEMIDFSEKLLSRIRWSRSDVGRFLGEYLSMPKAHVVFRPSRGKRPLERSLVRLDAKTQLLYSGKRFFINGEAVSVPHRHAATLRKLADSRLLPGERLAAPPLAALICGWQRLGYLHFERP